MGVWCHRVSEETAPMSIATPFDSESPAVYAQSLKTHLQEYGRAVEAFELPVETTAFWTAVALPLAYPALMFGGLDGQELFLLVATVAFHVAALGLGRGHGREK